jgi:hypothetical protein
MVEIAIRNSRENHRPMVGYTSDHSTKENRQTGIAEPNLVHGTGRLAPLFAKATKLFELMWTQTYTTRLMSPNFPHALIGTPGRFILKIFSKLLSPLFLVHMELQLQCGSDF